MAVVASSKSHKLAGGAPRAMNGAALVAQAMRQADPDVVAAYPITPQTIITETYSEFVANREVGSEFVSVESEHAALSTCIGAAAAGARVQTATSGPGLALMWELLGVASGMRLPIVMHLCTRALSAPLNIHGDHSDMMGMRDTGWVILSAETGQEAYDNALQAVRIAEDARVLLPTVNALDGFNTTHTMVRAELLPDEEARAFVRSYSPLRPLLDVENPVTYGTMDFTDFYTEHKYQQAEAMARAKEVVLEIAREFEEVTGRSYGLLAPYRMEDAEVAIVMMGAYTGTARLVVDELRNEGVKAGVIRVRCFRPFPSQEIAEALKHVQAVAVLDRATAFGGVGSPLFTDVATSLTINGLHPRLENWQYSLGGRDTRPAQIKTLFQGLLHPPKRPEPFTVRYLGLRA